MTARLVRSALRPSDPVFVPRGGGASQQGDHGTHVLSVYTQESDVPGGTAERVTAQEFAHRVGPYDEVVIDPAQDGSFGVRTLRDQKDTHGSVLWLDGWVPDTSETASAALTLRPPGRPITTARTDRVLADTAAACGGHAYGATWRDPDDAHRVRATAWLVVVPSAEVDRAVAELTTGFGTTPHPPVLVGSKGDFPLATRARMVLA